MEPASLVAQLPTPILVATSLAGGIAASPWVPGWFAWIAVAASALAITRRFRLPAAVCMLAVAVGLLRGAPGDPPFGGVAGVRWLVGTVEGPVAARGGSLLSTVDGDVWVWWPDGDVPLPGERVAVTGNLRLPTGPRGPGLPDRRAMLASRGAVAELTAREVERLADEPSLRAQAWRWAAAVQARWSAAIDDVCGSSPHGEPVPDAGAATARAGDGATVRGGDGATGESDVADRSGNARGREPPRARAPVVADGCEAAAALRGIATGDRSAVPADLDDRWRAAGIYHVLSVSGLHLAVVAGLAFALLRRLAAASPWGGRLHPAKVAAPPALLIAIAYTLVTGAEIATVRALIAIAAVLAAAMTDRPVRLIDAVGAAAIAVLVWRPADLFDPAFQLSFSAALTLAVRPTVELPLVATRAQRFARWIARGAASSAWIALATAPITAHHFHQVTPGGVIGNLVLTPPVELLALPMTLIGLVVGWDLPIALAVHLVDLVDAGAGALAEVAPVGNIALVPAPLVAALVALSLWLASRAARTRVDAAAWLAVCVAWSMGTSPPPPGALRVTFVDVGQGDAAIVELPDGAVWLVDAGGSAAAPDLAAASAPGRAIRRVLAAYGRKRIDVALVSHPHPDHYLGLFALGVPVGELWFAPEGDAGRAPPRGTAPLPGFASAAATLAARGTALVHPTLGTHDLGGGVELVAWAPRTAGHLAADPVRSVNDNSLVVELRYRGRSILFAGDLEAEGEDALVAAGLSGVDIVKVPHHGSPTSSTQAFVAATHPRAAIVSCGRDNRFRFPAAAVVDRWRAAGTRVARTDQEASIVVTIDASGDLRIDP